MQVLVTKVTNSEMHRPPVFKLWLSVRRSEREDGKSLLFEFERHKLNFFFLSLLSPWDFSPCESEK